MVEPLHTPAYEPIPPSTVHHRLSWYTLQLPQASLKPRRFLHDAGATVRARMHLPPFAHGWAAQAPAVSTLKAAAAGSNRSTAHAAISRPRLGVLRTPMLAPLLHARLRQGPGVLTGCLCAISNLEIAAMSSGGRVCGTSVPRHDESRNL